MSVEPGLSYWGKHRLTVFQKRLLRQAVQPQQDQPTGNRRTAQTGGSRYEHEGDQNKDNEMWQELRKKILNILLGTAEGNRPLEEPDVESINIKTDLPQIREEGVNWIDMA